MGLSHLAICRYISLPVGAFCKRAFFIFTFVGATSRSQLYARIHVYTLPELGLSILQKINEHVRICIIAKNYPNLSEFAVFFFSFFSKSAIF